MKFLYEYRTSDNAKHSGVIKAADREAAYALLKKKGIKPSRFAEAPGVFNKLFGKGKRWMAIAVLLLALAASSGYLLTLLDRNGELAARNQELIELGTKVNPIDRCQVYGDPAMLAEGTASGWANVFTNEAERILARYARPGVAVAPAAVSSMKSLAQSFEVALSCRVEYAEGDSSEIRKLKCIVEGMKVEARRYFAAGGTVNGYLKRLQRRQQYEVEYFESSKKMLTEAYKDTFRRQSTLELWTKRNETLRAMGIETIPRPSDE